MEPEGRYTIIGSLVLLLAAVIVFALVWLGGYSRVEQHFYTIYFEKQSLRGIQVGGDVSIRGLKVGQIVSYAISPANVNRVKVNIRVDGQSPVSTDTTAAISRNLVTSVARIDLETPNPPGPVLLNIPPGEVHPVIPEGSSEFEAISDAVNQIAITGDEALRNINELLNEDNRRAVTDSVNGLRTLMTGLSDRLQSLDVAARDLSRTAESIQASGERITTAIETTANGFNQALRPLASNANASLQDLRRTMSELNRTVAGLERSASTTLDRTAQVADIGLLEFRSTARDLRIVVDGLNRTLDKLADPRATLLGPGTGQLGPGER